MSTWHTAHIKFQYSAKSDLNHRVSTSVTIQVNDKKYGAVMAELRTKFPSCTNFVITEIDWEAWLRSMISQLQSQLVNFPINSPVCTQYQFQPIQLSWCWWFLALLNKIWGQEGCHPFLPLRTNRCVRFGFCGSSVLVGSSGQEVSCYTTVGGDGWSSSNGTLEKQWLSQPICFID